MHNEKAVGVIDYKAYDSYKTQYASAPNKRTDIVHTPYFRTNIIQVNGAKKLDYSDLDSFVIYMVVEGTCELQQGGQKYNLTTGMTVLFPALLKNVQLTASHAQILEVSL